jgi:hypothetical protein
MNHSRHFVLIVIPAIVLVATALPPDHFFYPVSDQTQGIRTARAVFLDSFLPIPDDHDPVKDTLSGFRSLLFSIHVSKSCKN